MKTKKIETSFECIVCRQNPCRGHFSFASLKGANEEQRKQIMEERLKILKLKGGE